MKFNIPMEWAVSTSVEVEAESLQDAVDIATDMELPKDAEYMSGSFVIWQGVIQQLNPTVTDEEIDDLSGVEE